MAKSSAFSSGFDEATFITAITETMKMGIPDDPAERLIFWWRRAETYVPDDPAGNPYDWTAPPVDDQPGNPDLPDPNPNVDQGLSVNYAAEFTARTAADATTVFGDIDSSRVVVTLLDGEFQKIKTADYATIGDTTYRILFDAPAIGLFGVTVWSLHLEAVDST